MISIVAGFGSSMLTMISGYEECFALEFTRYSVALHCRGMKQLQMKSLQTLHFNLGLFQRKDDMFPVSCIHRGFLGR
jgi:hypothetical protein